MIVFVRFHKELEKPIHEVAEARKEAEARREAADKSRRLVGKWAYSGKRLQVVYTFFADGTWKKAGSFDGKKFELRGTWRIEGDLLYIKESQASEAVAYKIITLTDDTFATRGDDGEGVDYTRINK